MAKRRRHLLASRHDLSADKQLLRVLFYGRSGSTKTRTVYSAVKDARTHPTLGLNLAGQPASIRDYRPRPDIIDIEKLTDLNLFYSWLLGGQVADSQLVRKFDLHPPYKCLVIDGLTEIQRHVANDVTGNASKGPGDRRVRLEIQHHGDILAQMCAIANMFYSLPMHVLMTALEREDKDESTGGFLYRVLLTGQSAGQVPSYAEAVGWLRHAEKLPKADRTRLSAHLPVDATSVCYFRPSTRYDAKDQYGAFGDVMIDPTITKLLDCIESVAEGGDSD